MAMRAFTVVGSLLVVASAQSPLSPPVAPPQNPVTAAKAVLGKALFWDEQLSSSGRMACGTCHRPASGGGDPRRRRHPGLDGILLTADDTWGSPGIERRDVFGAFERDLRFGYDEQVTPRAAPGVAMAAWFDLQFWDGRFGGAFTDPETGVVVIPNGGSLEAQALHPFRNDVEMAREGRGWAEVRQRVDAVAPLALASGLTPDLQAAVATAGDSYRPLFAAAFGDPAVTLPRVAMALASYLRSLVPNQTPWDQHVLGVPGAMTTNQQAGWQLFQHVAKCSECHTPGLFTDRQFRANGLQPVAQDPGRGGITGLPGDLGTFKVPSLRNVGLKSTFMHNGRFTNVTQVVNFYRNGAGTEPPLDPLHQPFSIDQTELAQLVDFVENGLVDPRARFGLPPFDRPTLFTETAPIGSNELGVATSVGGITPRLRAQLPPFLGSSEWAIAVTDAVPSAAGLMAIAGAPGTGVPLAGVAMYADPAALLLVLPITTDALGAATVALPVPFEPSVRGLPLWAQGLVASGPSWGGTRGAALVLR